MPEEERAFTIANQREEGSRIYVKCPHCEKRSYIVITEKTRTTTISLCECSECGSEFSVRVNIYVKSEKVPGTEEVGNGPVPF